MPEPFDVRTEEGLEAGVLPLIDFVGMEASQDSGRSSGQGFIVILGHLNKVVVSRLQVRDLL